MNVRTDSFRIPVTHPRTRAVALLPALVVAAALAAEPAPPLRTVALCRLDVPARISDPDAARSLWEGLITGRLESAGLQVIPPAACAEAWTTAVRETGGLHDILTGEIRPDRVDAATHAALRSLSTGPGADAWLRPALALVEAPYVRGKAEWDGAAATVRMAGGSGTVDAISLVLVVQGLDGREVHSGRWGVQPLTRFNWNDKPGEVPREKLFLDREAVEAAVDRAIGPFAAAARSGSLLRAAPAEVPGLPAAAPAKPVPAAAVLPAGSRGLALALPRVTGRVPGGEHARLQGTVAGLLRAELEAAGYTVLPPEVHEAVWTRHATEAGGLYDPFTGEKHADREKAVDEAVRKDLADRTGGGPVVRSALVAVPAPFVGEVARWDGTSETVTEIATWKKALTLTTGTAEALSLVIVVHGAAGDAICTGSGGIQLLRRVEKGAFVPVPGPQLLSDPQRAQAAVRRALECFLRPPG